MNLDVSKKIEGIIQSNALDDLSLKYLPPVSDSPDNYYFISYSHKDYKQVYPDIYALQAEGVNVWYDRAMPAGKSWKETAEKYIRPSRCAGVVFYVSDNSLLSPAIHEEIAFAKQCGKSCLTINLPTSDGKSHSAKEMLDVMQANGIEIPSDRYEFVANAFGDEVLYLPYSQSAEQKAEKILKLKKQSLLNFSYFRAGGGVRLTSINDIEAVKIDQEDWISYDSETNRENTPYLISVCALANCRRLKSVYMPYHIHSIGAYAFLGCVSLSSIDLSNVYTVDESAFSGCTGLQKIDFKQRGILKVLGNNAFCGCESLKKVDLPSTLESIGAAAFQYSGLEEITLLSTLQTIGDYAFANSKIKKITIPDKIEVLQPHTFEECRDLKEVTLGDGMTVLDLSIFKTCSSLQTIRLGKNIKEIRDLGYIFQLENLQSIIADKKNPFYKTVDGCLIETETLKPIFVGSEGKIPNCIQNLDTDSTYVCKSIEEVFIGEGLQTVNLGIFSSCRPLRAISIGKNIKEIRNLEGLRDLKDLQSIIVDDENPKYKTVDNCLIDCESKKLLFIGKQGVPPIGIEHIDVATVLAFRGLENVIFDFSKITVLDLSLLENCHSLKTIRIGQNIKAIRSLGTLRLLDSLESIVVDDANSVYRSIYNCLIEIESQTVLFIGKQGVIPDDGTVTCLSESAFDCICRLDKAFIPRYIEMIEVGAGPKTNNLTQISVHLSNTHYHSEGDCLLETASGRLILGCSSSVIPNNGSVTTIDEYAFCNCDNLTEVTIPSAVREINKFAFVGCSNLKRLYIKGSGLLRVDDRAFAKTDISRVYVDDVEMWSYVDFLADQTNPYLYIQGKRYKGE